MKTNLKIYKVILVITLCITIIFPGCSSNIKSTETKGNNSSPKIITDMGGRKVELPSKIEKVYGANPMSTILLFTLVPDMLIGWNSQLPNSEYLPKKYKTLPVIGSLGTKENAGSSEDILKYNPDIILFAQTEINTAAINKADKISKQTGKPVILVNGSLENCDSTYTLLGKVFNCQERTNKFIAYYKNTLSTIQKIKSQINDKNKVKIYYGKNDNALTTSGSKSVHAKLIEAVGGINSANTVQGSEDSNINIENVLKWQPDVILLSEANSNEKDNIDKIENNPAWQGIKAIKNKKVYTSPQLIFSWFDRPPSINELIGMKWLAVTLYPNYYNFNIKNEIETFYKLFYNINLTDEQVDKILN